MHHFLELAEHRYDDYFEFFSDHLYTSVSLGSISENSSYSSDWAIVPCFFVFLVTLCCYPCTWRNIHRSSLYKLTSHWEKPSPWSAQLEILEAFKTLLWMWLVWASVCRFLIKEIFCLFASQELIIPCSLWCLSAILGSSEAATCHPALLQFQQPPDIYLEYVQSHWCPNLGKTETSPSGSPWRAGTFYTHSILLPSVLASVCCTKDLVEQQHAIQLLSSS